MELKTIRLAITEIPSKVIRMPGRIEPIKAATIVVVGIARLIASIGKDASLNGTPK